MVYEIRVLSVNSYSSEGVFAGSTLCITIHLVRVGRTLVAHINFPV